MEEKDLNTYVDNICNEHTFIVRYQGIRIIPTKSAKVELFKYGLRLEDCKKILDQGYSAPRKRSKNTIERWFDKSNKTYNVVIAGDTNNFLKENVWILIHVGKFTRRKLR